MKKFATLSLASAFLLGSLSIYLSNATPSYGVNTAKFQTVKDPIRGSYVVVLKDQSLTGRGKQRAVQVKSLAQSLIASKVGGRGKVKFAYSAAITGFSVKMSAADARKLSQDSRVEYVAEDGKVRLVGTQLNPPAWGLDRIDQRTLPLNNKYTFPYVARTVTAYIIDTGIFTTHPDFGGRAQAVFGSIGDGYDTTDCNGHGTHVAGTVGSATYGVAKQVKLRAVRVLDCAGSGTYSGVIAGVDYVTANHSGPSVANMSLGGGAFPALDTAVRNSVASGVTYVVAAGNSGQDARNFSPARVGVAITVGATGVNDARASFSNFGPILDIFAPGVDILSTSNSGGTLTLSGTSMAAPHVAGAAAMYLHKFPKASPATVAKALIDQSTKSVVKRQGTGSPNRLLFR